MGHFVFSTYVSSRFVFAMGGGGNGRCAMALLGEWVGPLIQGLRAETISEEHWRIFIICASQQLCCGPTVSRLAPSPTFLSSLDWPETQREEIRAVLEVRILRTASAR